MAVLQIFPILIGYLIWLNNVEITKKILTSSSSIDSGNISSSSPNSTLQSQKLGPSRDARKLQAYGNYGSMEFQNYSPMESECFSVHGDYLDIDNGLGSFSVGRLNPGKSLHPLRSWLQALSSFMAYLWLPQLVQPPKSLLYFISVDIVLQLYKFLS